MYGVEEFNVILNGKRFIFVQYGGMPQNKRRLSKVYLSVKFIVYVANLCGYCKENIEIISSNELEESFIVASELSKNIDYQNSMFILVYNNVNCFKEMLKKKSFKKYYEKYQGEDDFDEVVQYITNEFKKRIDSDRIISVLHVEDQEKHSITKLYQKLSKIFLENDEKTNGK